MNIPIYVLQMKKINNFLFQINSTFSMEKIAIFMKHSKANRVCFLVKTALQNQNG